jgi:hypothetical protein
MTCRALCIAVSLIALLAMSGCGGSSEETTETGNKSTTYSRCVHAKIQALSSDRNVFQRPPSYFKRRARAASIKCAHSLVRSGRYTPAEVKSMAEEDEFQLIH